MIECSLKKVLQVNLEDTPILFTEQAIHNKDIRMKLTEHMFEKHNIPGLFIVKDPVLCSFSCGRSSALVLDCGSQRSVTTPVFDGYALLKCINKHPIGGEKITQDLFDFVEN